MCHVVSLYDYTAEALRPWADAGYHCFAYDIRHTRTPRKEGNIMYVHADLHNTETITRIIEQHRGKAAFMCAFPVCTDLAGSGAPHFARKREIDPHFQATAAGHARACEQVANAIGCTKFYIENPVGALSTLWRKPDHYFNPCQYGGYIPLIDAEHPRFPTYIPPRDAYTKKTCLWVGPEFVMPAYDAVEPEVIRYAGKAYSRVHGKLGGTSEKTKTIRSATPRGFSIAVFTANAPH